MRMELGKLPHFYDEARDVMAIAGIEYSGEIFRQLGGLLPVDTVFKLAARADGMLTIMEMYEAKAEDGAWRPLATPADEPKETPELRQWATEQALKTQDSQHSNATFVIWSAQRYIDYVLKGNQ